MRAKRDKTLTMLHRLKGVHDWEIERDKKGRFTGREFCLCGETRPRNAWEQTQQRYGGLTSTSGTVGLQHLTMASMEKAVNEMMEIKYQPQVTILNSEILKKLKALDK